MKLIFYILLTIFPIALLGQKNRMADLPDYPQDYFRNPLDIPIFLAGNFGECRPGHFHSGIDIKTLGKENQPVHAAADGYISRIKMDKNGFGHALYITHPNGYTTLYAHLNDFAPAIQKYMKHEQYDKKHWDVDIQLPPSQFPVKKGQQIAWSGNTGGSTAPHLHFEIRNTKTEHPLNPQLFGLPIIDKMPPVPKEVFFYYGHPYLSGYQSSIYEDTVISMTLTKKEEVYKPLKAETLKFNNKKEINPNIIGGGSDISADLAYIYYRPIIINNDTVNLFPDNIAIGINVDDYMDGSDNTIAFYTAKLFMDDSLQAQVTLDDIGYDETRYMNAYSDYKTKQQAHKWVQLLFQLPGNRLEHIYSNLNEYKGRLNLSDKQTHKINIIITDDKGNESKIAFYGRSKSVNEKFAQNELTDDHFIQFLVNKVNNFSNPHIAFSLDERQLYDNIRFRFTSTSNGNTYSDKYDLHYPYVPIHHYFDLKIKPNKLVPAELKNKVVMKYSDGNDEDGRAATATDESWYKVAVRNFGTYWLDIDTIPPMIKSLQKDNSNLCKAKQITFEAKDNMTSVKTFNGYLDGKWICFEQHGDLFFYKFDEHCPKGKHKLVFKAEDENGNVRIVNLNFVR